MRKADEKQRIDGDAMKAWMKGGSRDGCCAALTRTRLMLFSRCVAFPNGPFVFDFEMFVGMRFLKTMGLWLGSDPEISKLASERNAGCLK